VRGPGHQPEGEREVKGMPEEPWCMAEMPAGISSELVSITVAGLVS
jgi:hypothetical protein